MSERGQPPAPRPHNGSNLLPEEHLESFSPTLARVFGLNEAIILQKVHSWVRLNERKQQTFHGGHYWTFNSVKAWQAAFPWAALNTLNRAFNRLREAGILIAEQLAEDPRDRTLWYRIDYAVLYALDLSEPPAVTERAEPGPAVTNPSTQNGGVHSPILGKWTPPALEACIHPNWVNDNKEQLLASTTIPTTTVAPQSGASADNKQLEGYHAERWVDSSPPLVARSTVRKPRGQRSEESAELFTVLESLMFHNEDDASSRDTSAVNAVLDLLEAKNLDTLDNVIGILTYIGEHRLVGTYDEITLPKWRQLIPLYVAARDAGEK